MSRGFCLGTHNTSYKTGLVYRLKSTLLISRVKGMVCTPKRHFYLKTLQTGSKNESSIRNTSE